MDITKNITIERNIIIYSKYINKNLEENILNELKNQIEEKCIPEGYVVKDSTTIIKRSIGHVIPNTFKANISYFILCQVSIINPYKNDILEAKVLDINKAGLFCNNGPLSIIIPKRNYNDDYSNINIGDTIKIKVFDKKFKLYDNEIQVVAELYKDEKEEKLKKIIKSDSIYDKDIIIKESTMDDSDISIGSIAELDETESIDSNYLGEEEDDELFEENASLLNKEKQILNEQEEEDEEEVEEDEEELIDLEDEKEEDEEEDNEED